MHINFSVTTIGLFLIAVIDLSHRRLDAGYQLLAMKALEKWRRQSDRSSIDDLLLTLRKMKKNKTIDKIRRQVFTNGVQ